MFCSAILLTFAAAAPVVSNPALAQEMDSPWAPVTQSLERIALPKTKAPIEVVLFPRSRHLGLRGESKSDLNAVASAIRAHPPASCSAFELQNTQLVFHCRTNRLDASISMEQGASILNLRLLKGLPWKEAAGGFPQVFYPPEKVELGDPCPGTNAAAKAECALLEGHWDEAKPLLREALGTPEWTLAALRLGDLALASDDPSSALSWYRRAEGIGSFGRLASLRICQLLGRCNASGGEDVFDTSGLPDPIQLEIELRQVQQLAFDGRWRQAALAAAQSLNRHPPSAFPPALYRFVQQVALTTLRENDPELWDEAFALYLALNMPSADPLAVQLAAEAAELAARAGAPSYGARLLSSITPWVSPEKLGAHLARTSELYLAGNDAVRASMVLEFAQARLSKSVLSGSRWKSIARMARRRPEPPPPSVKTDLLASESTLDLSEAVLAQSLSRSQRRREGR